MGTEIFDTLLSLTTIGTLLTLTTIDTSADFKLNYQMKDLTFKTCFFRKKAKRILLKR